MMLALGITSDFGANHTARAERLGIGTTEVRSATHEAAAIEATSPTHLAFNGKSAARAALGRKVDYGPQPERIGGATVWVLPSTSGAARGFWDIEPWRELARAALAA